MSNLLGNYYTNLNNLRIINIDDLSSTNGTFTNLTVSNLNITNIVIPNYVDLSSNQVINGLKTFTQNLQLNSGLVLNNGGLILSNGNLQKIAFISSATEDLQNAINTLKTKTQLQSYNSTFNSTVFSNNLVSNSQFQATGILRIDGPVWITGANQYTNAQVASIFANTVGLTSSAQTQLSALQTKTTNITFTSPQTIISGTTTTATLSFTGTLNNLSKAGFDTLVNNTSSLVGPIQPQIDSINTNVSTVTGKVTNISYNAVSNTTTISNNVNIQSLQITSSINSFSKANFENAITQSISLTSPAQTQINSLIASVAATDAVVAGNTAAIALINTTTIPALQLQITTLSGEVTAIDGRVSTLESKTTQQTYSSALSKTTFGATLQANAFQFSTLSSGFTQTANQEVILIGNTRIRNNLFLENGFGINTEGGITQTIAGSTNYFAGSLTSNNTLTVNGLTSFNNDVTITGTKKLIVKNIVPIAFDDIYFGSTAGYETDDCIFNMMVKINQPININNSFQMGTNLSRYPFGCYTTEFGVDANSSITLNTPVLNLSGTQVNCNNLNSSTAMNINANTINIGTNQGLSAFNGINIGNIASLSVINLNGVVYSTFPLSITGAISQW